MGCEMYRLVEITLGPFVALTVSSELLVENLPRCEGFAP